MESIDLQMVLAHIATASNIQMHIIRNRLASCDFNDDIKAALKDVLNLSIYINQQCNEGIEFTSTTASMNPIKGTIESMVTPERAAKVTPRSALSSRSSPRSQQRSHKENLTEKPSLTSCIASPGPVSNNITTGFDRLLIKLLSPSHITESKSEIVSNYNKCGDSEASHATPSMSTFLKQSQKNNIDCSPGLITLNCNGDEHSVGSSEPALCSIDSRKSDGDDNRDRYSATICLATPEKTATDLREPLSSPTAATATNTTPVTVVQAHKTEAMRQLSRYTATTAADGDVDSVVAVTPKYLSDYNDVMCGDGDGGCDTVLAVAQQTSDRRLFTTPPRVGFEGSSGSASNSARKTVTPHKSRSASPFSLIKTTPMELSHIPPNKMNLRQSWKLAIPSSAKSPSIYKLDDESSR